MRGHTVLPNRTRPRCARQYSSNAGSYIPMASSRKSSLWMLALRTVRVVGFWKLTRIGVGGSQPITYLRLGCRMHGFSSKENTTSSAQNNLAPIGPRPIKERSLEFAGGSEFPRILSSRDGRVYHVVRF